MEWLIGKTAVKKGITRAFIVELGKKGWYNLMCIWNTRKIMQSYEYAIHKTKGAVFKEVRICI